MLRNLACSICLLIASNAQGATYRVDDDSPALNPDGATWSSAYKYLQDALDRAQSGDLILVAGGTYRPDEDTTDLFSPEHIMNERSERFLVKDGVRVFGGYAGLANPGSEDTRNVGVYSTFLTGEIGSAEYATDNAYHVVETAPTTPTTPQVLDGLYIWFGYADGPIDPDDRVGAGIFIPAGSRPTIVNCKVNFNSAPTAQGKGAAIYLKGDGLGSPDAVVNLCSFQGNYAGDRGGAAFIEDASPQFTDCIADSNIAENAGGGLFLRTLGPTLLGKSTFLRCILTSNRVESNSGFGGGLACEGSIGYESGHKPSFRDCLFHANVVWNGGGGGGADCFHAGMTFVKCTFDSNVARSQIGGIAWGGGMSVDFGAHVIDCVFRFNKTLDSDMNVTGIGGGLYVSKTIPELVNSLFYGNESGEGGGMYAEGFDQCGPLAFGPAVFTGINCTFAENIATLRGGGFSGCGGNSALSQSFHNCIFWGNLGGQTTEEAQVFVASPDRLGMTYSCVQDDAPGAPVPFPSTPPYDPNNIGNIDDDPVFMSNVAHNYRLRRCSPAIDAAASPALPQDTLNLDADLYSVCGNDCTEFFASGERVPDLDFRSRVLDESSRPDTDVADEQCLVSCQLHVDMGAYEFAYSDCPNPGDMNHDGFINGRDIQIYTYCATDPLLSKFNCACADLNMNGVIDQGDMDCLISKLLWGSSTCDGVADCVGGFAGLLAMGAEIEPAAPSAYAGDWMTLVMDAAASANNSALAAASTSAEAQSANATGVVDEFEMAARWNRMANWLATHPRRDYSTISTIGYDQWVANRLRLIVIEGAVE